MTMASLHRDTQLTDQKTTTIFISICWRKNNPTQNDTNLHNDDVICLFFFFALNGGGEEMTQNRVEMVCHTLHI